MAYWEYAALNMIAPFAINESIIVFSNKNCYILVEFINCIEVFIKKLLFVVQLDSYLPIFPIIDLFFTAQKIFQVKDNIMVIILKILSLENPRFMVYILIMVFIAISKYLDLKLMTFLLLILIRFLEWVQFFISSFYSTLT